MSRAATAFGSRDAVSKPRRVHDAKRNPFLTSALSSKGVFAEKGGKFSLTPLGTTQALQTGKSVLFLLEANPGGLQRTTQVQPDGDAELDADLVAVFQVVACKLCGGDLKPDVVFFGGTVSEPTLAAAWDLFDRGEVLLVVGSSLTVYSGFRFVRRASERKRSRTS